MKKLLIGLTILVTLLIADLAVAKDVATKLPAKSAPVTTIQSKSSSGGVILTKDNTLVINDIFEGEVVANIVQKAKQLDSKLPSNEPIYLVINSPGGSIDDGIELIENLNNLNRPVNTVSLFAASMGFQTVQGVKGRRLLTTNGTLMSHKARGMFYGEFPGQLDSRYSHYLRRVTRLDEQAVRRTNGRHTLKSYEALIENEYWCDGSDCLKQGFADAIVAPKCDASLNGSHEHVFDRFLYMGHVIEIVEQLSDCPMITTALSWNAYIDGEPLFGNYDKKDTKTNTAPVDPYASYSYGYSYTKTFNQVVINNVGLETAENIKKLITKKMDARSQGSRRDVVKY